MSKRVTADAYLQKALRTGKLVEIQRSVLDARKEECFVVGMGRRWVLFELLDNAVRLDGYMAVRRRDVARVRPSPRPFSRRALAVSGQERHIPLGIDLDDTRGVLRTGTAVFRIVTIHTEYTDPDVAYVGRARPGKKGLRLDEISPNAKWRKKPAWFRYWCISRIDFDGQYERALLTVADADAAAKRQKQQERKQQERVQRAKQKRKQQAQKR